MFYQLTESRALISRVCARARRATPRVRRASRERATFYRNLWTAAAARVGAEVAYRQGELLAIRRGDSTTHVFRNYTDLDGPATLRAAGDKPYVHARLRSLGIPTPEHQVFSLQDIHVAERFLQQHRPCVVKPAAGVGAGDGVTTGVASSRDLKRAAWAAAAYCDRLLIERQIAGENLRLLLLDGRLLDTVHRRPPRVIGDGRSTIRALIQTTNSRRNYDGAANAQVQLRNDLDLRRTLRRQGLSLRSVPADGEVVSVKTVINDNAADDNIPIAEHHLAPTLIEAARRAAQALNIRLAGVDVITSDPSKSMAEASGVVLEVNTTPGLYIHEQPRPGSVVDDILIACLSNTAITGSEGYRVLATQPETSSWQP